LEASLSLKLKHGEDINFQEVAMPLADVYDSATRPWELLQHLSSVMETPELRTMSAKLEPVVVAFRQELAQSRPIYDAFVRLQSSNAFAQLPEAHQRIVLSEVRDRKLSGVSLEGAESEEFNSVSQRLSKLSTDFSNHVLDSTAAWNLTLHEAKQVRGIPPRVLSAAAARAREGGSKNASDDNGPWMFGLDGPTYGPVMTYAEDQELRKTLFWARARLASSGKNDNAPTIAEILEKRHRLADLLGYGSYADLSFASKMATRAEVHKLMDSLQSMARGPAQSDVAELLDFAKQTMNATSVNHWDRGFYVERLRKEKFQYDSEALRSYFPLPVVLQGLFGLSSRLFGADVSEVPSAEAKRVFWEASVQLFRVSVGGQSKGHVFFDLYSRPGQKRAGAWVSPLVSRRKLEGGVVRDPVAVVVCNFPPPQDGKPSLLAFGEVETLFHEFGHALQHVLTTQDDSAVSGINGIEWDAVEIASQFMEYWVTDDRETLYSFAKHYETGEPLPENAYTNMMAAKYFRAGSGILGQIYLGTIDLRLHEQYEKGEDVFAIDRGVAAAILPEPPLEGDRFLCAFQHIFSGGYASGYYSYQWSKVLSADAFSAFEEDGGLLNATRVAAVGRRFAGTVLALGGGRAPAQVFQDFRGRRPTAQALLRYSGLPAVGARATEALL
jgi:oligopeptidase A